MNWNTYSVQCTPLTLYCEVMIQFNVMLLVHIDVQSFTVQISKVVRISVISR